jgi:hypothetical protein
MLADRKCFTRKFGSPPTPAPAMNAGSEGGDDDGEVDDAAEYVGKCVIEEAPPV